MTNRQNSSASVTQPVDFSLGGVDAPPFRIQPGRKLTVQTLGTFAAAAANRLEVSFWYSERRYAVGQ